MMKKKWIWFFSCLGLLVAVGLSSVPAHAAGDNQLPSDYYVVKPILNTQLQVQYSFRLGNHDTQFQQFEFFYIPEKDAYLINNQYGFSSVQWTGNIGVHNLKWQTERNRNEASMLWIVEQVSHGQYIIRNKKEPTMVWDVHHYYANSGTAIKLERLHHQYSPYRAAQLFTIER